MNNRPLSLFYSYGFVTFSSEEDVRNVTEMVGIAYGLSLQTLQCDHCNQGHFDKVDQSDYRRITIHSKKVGCWQLVNNLLETQNLILIANIIRESKMFRKSRHFFKLCIQHPEDISLTQTVFFILSSTSIFSAPISLLFRNMWPQVKIITIIYVFCLRHPL